ncbi:zinc finger, PMZ-type containing protein [Tanacetum coccineum]
MSVNTSNGNNYFSSYYVCFKGVKDGWINGCRKVIGLDGCFLKSVCQGQLLAAMGRDVNNHIFPLAWAVALECDYNVFEARNEYNAFVVDIRARTCSCRSWQLSGIPCVHTVAALAFLNKDPETYVCEWLKKDMFKEAYKYPIRPLKDSSFWPKTDDIKPLPLKERRMPSRPCVNRKRGACEKDRKNVKVGFGRKMTCRKCYGKGHNSRSYKKQKTDPPPKDVRPKGRSKRVVAPTSERASTSGIEVCDEMVWSNNVLSCRVRKDPPENSDGEKKYKKQKHVGELSSCKEKVTFESVDYDTQPSFPDNQANSTVMFAKRLKKCLNINKLTKEDINRRKSDGFEAFKNTFMRRTEYEYNLDQVMLSMFEEMDWVNPESSDNKQQERFSDLTKPLPLMYGNKERNYSLSLTKRPTTEYNLDGIEEEISILFRSKVIVYDEDA